MCRAADRWCLPAVELVTATGEVIDIDAASDPDMFWGLRGGGGNVGVATPFTSRLHPVTTVTGGLILSLCTPAFRVIEGGQRP